MKFYKVKVMTEKDYAEMMNGEYHYTSKEIITKADNAVKAINIIKNTYPNLVVISDPESNYEVEKMEHWAQKKQKEAKNKNMSVLNYLDWEETEQRCEKTFRFIEEVRNCAALYCDSIAEDVIFLKQHNKAIPEGLLNDIIKALESQNYELEKTKERIKQLEKLKNFLIEEG